MRIRNVSGFFTICFLLGCGQLAASDTCREILVLRNIRFPTQVAQVASDDARGAIYVRTERTELYRTVDSGVTWDVLTPEDAGGGALRVALDPLNSATIYRTSDHGVFKSDDAGRTWLRIDSGFAYPPDGAIAVTQTTPPVIYVAMSGSCTSRTACSGYGVMKSADGGKSWQQAGLAQVVIRDIVIDPQNPDVVYATTWGEREWEVYRSADGGALWSAMFGRPVWVESWQIHPLDSQIIYMTWRYWFSMLLSRSDSGGRSWNDIRPSIADFEPVPCGDSPDCVTQPQVTGVLFDDRHPGVMYGSTWNRVVRSADGGTSWQYLAGTPSGTAALKAMRFDNTVLFATGKKSSAEAALYRCETPPADGLFAFFKPDPIVVPVGSTIRFIDESFGAIVSWSWSFGDGTTAGERNPAHVYSRAGTYDVTLTVNDGKTSHHTTRSVVVVDGSRRRSIRH